MEHEDQEPFAALLRDVLAFYRQDLSPFAVSVWWQSCSGFELGQIRKAMTAHAMDPERGQFAPKPADIVRQLHGTQTDRSLIAWGKVLEAIKRVGAYQSVVFDDGAIHAAIEDMGGWPAVCRTDNDDLPFVQRRFCEAHRAYSRRSDIAYPPKLIGESEQRNAVHGFRSAAPALVGDPEKAQRVASNGVHGGKVRITHAASLAPTAALRLGNAA